MEQIHQNSAVCYGLLSGLTVHVAVGVMALLLLLLQEKEEGLQKEVLEQVIQEVEALRSESPQEHVNEQVWQSYFHLLSYFHNRNLS